MSTLSDLLKSRQGNYEGRDVNHEGEPFDGYLSLRWAWAPDAACWDFIAKVDPGLVVHGEHSVLAADEAGVPGLWTVSNNRPHVVRYAVSDVVEDEKGHVVVFSDGDPEDESRFRSRIRLWRCSRTAAWATTTPGASPAGPSRSDPGSEWRAWRPRRRHPPLYSAPDIWRTRRVAPSHGHPVRTGSRHSPGALRRRGPGRRRR